MPDPNAPSTEPSAVASPTIPFGPEPPLWQKILGILLLVILLPFRFIWWLVKSTFTSFWDWPWN